MAKLGINTGSSPDAGDGDSLLIGAIKINSNFDEIYNTIGDGTSINNRIGYASSAGIATYASTSRIVVKDSGLTSAVAGVSTTTIFQVQSTDPYTINPTLGSISVGNLDFSSLNPTRPGWLTGRRPSQGQLFPRGVYNK